MSKEHLYRLKIAMDYYLHNKAMSIEEYKAFAKSSERLELEILAAELTE